MHYNHQLNTAKDHDIIRELGGYYAVFIRQGRGFKRHVLRAKSDFDAALKIKKLTGVMPESQYDVIGPLPSSSHGYDKKTRDIWLGK